MVRRAHHTGLMRTRDLLFGVYMVILYKLEWRDTHKIINAMAQWMKGVSLKEFEQFAAEVVQKDLIPEIRTELIEEIAHHKANGARNVMLSAAMAQVCEPISEYLDLDDVICSHLEIKGDKFTGKPLGKLNFQEEKLVRMLGYSEGYPCDLQKVYYYADSISDVPVLEKIGYPICVGPDRHLARLARKEGWRVIP